MNFWRHSIWHKRWHRWIDFPLRRWWKHMRIQRRHRSWLGLVGLGLVGAIALSLVPYHPNIAQTPPTQSAPSFAQQGKHEYDAGNFTAAIQSLNTAAELFESQSDWSAFAATLTNLGRAEFAKGEFEAALQRWDHAAAVYGDRLQNPNGVIQSQLYQAQTLQEMGLYPRACQTLTHALSLTPELCTTQRITPDVLGHKQLSDPDAPQTMGWQMLGDLLRTMGRLDESQQVLQTLVTDLPASSTKAASQLSLGNTLYALGNRERERRSPQKFEFVPWRCDVDEVVPFAAKTYYQQADETYQHVINASATSPSTQLKAQVNQVRVANQLGVERLNNQTTSPLNYIKDLQSLPPNRSRVYAQIQLAKSAVCRNQYLNQTPQWAQIDPILTAAYQDAQSIGDQQLQSYVLGTTAGLAEYRRNNLKHNALDLTTQALYLAEQQQANELIYQWQWQRGRILKALGQQEDAIASYKLAIQTLETIREDLLFVSSDVQFSFRDNVEPIYRELIGLLFAQSVPSISTSSPTSHAEFPLLPSLANKNLPKSPALPLPQSTLGNALYYVETLQHAELVNFLQCNVESLDIGAIARLSTQTNPTDVLLSRSDRILAQDPTAALIYPIVLDEAIAVILKQPGQELRYITTAIPHETVEATLSQLQRYLKDPSRTNTVKQLSRQVYDWLIKPLETELDSDGAIESSAVKNLVFVLDGSLRNVPMSLLYDQERQRYLLERYAISVSSGLQLLSTDSQSESSIPFNALVAGLSQEREFGGRQFSALSNVPKELAAIQDAVPSQQLLDETFIRSTLQTTLQKTSFSVVHMATHGKFSSDPEDTFIVLSDGPLKAQEFDQLLRTDNADLARTIELLVLSACETAAGDKRATLGLAGMALRSGAESTLATLWQVDDASTADVMVAFYQQLSNDPTLTKAEALRLAQLSLWHNKQQDWGIPFFWAPYVLVGNWI